MVWNMAAEFAACAVVFIVLISAHKINMISTLKNRIFQLCLVVSFTSISTNLLGAFLINEITRFPIWLTWLVNLAYFVATPLLSTLYFFYCGAYLLPNDKNIKKLLWWWSLPYAAYLLLVFANPWTGHLFTLSVTEGYARGPLNSAAYFVFYSYCILCVLLLIIKRKTSSGAATKMLLLFSLLLLPPIIFQQCFPVFVLSGAVAACALLILFLHIQNDRISADYLTGLPNRQDFLKVLAHRVQEKKSQATAIVISLNKFKFINDRFGPQSGDQLLQKLASSLSVITAPNLLYRYGGDQFAILLENQDEKPLLAEITNRLSRPVKIGNYRYIISAAVGVVQYPEVAQSTESLLGGLEYVLLLAKKDKSNQPCYCTRSMLDQVNRKKVILQILQDALRDDSFEVYFQPIWSVELHRFTMAEALLRLNNTSLGSISPGEFIPIAEDTGLIIDITYQVLNKVCRFIKEALALGVDIDAVAINMSFIQFMQDGLDEKLLNIIKNHQVPCSKIKIEITEGVLISNFEMVKKFISSMSVHNVRFGLDDFGTGYSNIASMLQIPFDTIKLDKSLIWSSMDSRKTAFFIKDITGAFKKMDLLVLAEGVETEEQYQFAVDCCCDGIQGFLFARPMTGDETKRTFLEQLSCRLEPPCLK